MTTAAKYGLDLQISPEGGDQQKPFAANQVTEKYTNLFDSFHNDNSNAGHHPTDYSTRPKSLLEGLIVLWATEKVYLDAWSFAKSLTISNDEDRSQDLDGGVLNKEFIPNWTSKDFVAFVEEIEGCVNDLAGKEGLGGATELGLRVWKQVLELETDFWPRVQ